MKQVHRVNCKRKEAYPSQEVGERELERILGNRVLRFQDSPELHVYRCKVTNHWHLGHGREG